MLELKKMLLQSLYTWVVAVNSLPAIATWTGCVQLNLSFPRVGLLQLGLNLNLTSIQGLGWRLWSLTSPYQTLYSWALLVIKYTARNTLKQQIHTDTLSLNDLLQDSDSINRMEGLYCSEEMRKVERTLDFSHHLCWMTVIVTSFFLISSFLFFFFFVKKKKKKFSFRSSLLYLEQQIFTLEFYYTFGC